MFQLQGLNIILQSQVTLRALVLSVKICCSKFQEAAPVAGRSSPVAGKALSLQPQSFGLPYLMGGGPLSSRPPQLPDLPFAVRQSNAVDRSITEVPVQLSSTILTQADIEYAVVPEPPTNNKRRRQQSPVRNFSLPTFHLTQPRTMTRYYLSALTPDDKTALAQGEQNHNLKSWTPENLILQEETRKDLAPTNVYIGPDKQVCIIPSIIVTDGQDQRAHIKQLAYKYHTSRCSSAPSVPSKETGSIALERTYYFAACRTASNGSYFVDNQRSMSCRPPHPPTAEVRVRSPLANEVSIPRPQKEVNFR